MSRLIFDLTDEDRDLLEKHRIRLGVRSYAEALRSLIREKSRSREIASLAVQIAEEAADPGGHIRQNRRTKALIQSTTAPKPGLAHLPRPPPPPAPYGSRLKKR